MPRHGCQDQLLLLWPETGEAAQPTLCGGNLQFVDRPKAEPLVEQSHGLRPHALEVEKIKDGGGKLAQQLLMERQTSSFGDLSDFFGDCLADARDGKELLGVEFSEGLARMADDVGCCAVGSDLKSILAFEFKEIADIGE